MPESRWVPDLGLGFLLGRSGVNMGGDCVPYRTLWQGVTDDPKQAEHPDRHEERRL